MNFFKRTKNIVQNIFARNRFLQSHKAASSINSKLNLQLIISSSFFILSIANIFSKSYVMLSLTLSGCIINLVSLIIAKKLQKESISSFSAIATCSLLFAFFVIYGGNNGFACLWVVLLPFFAMVVMDFIIGLCASIFFQIFLIVIFWTPIRTMLFYQYNDQFCLRFPLFFFVTFMLGLLLTISLQKSQYNEHKHLLELEEMTAVAHHLARIDPLTELANRRCAYEEFASRFTKSGPHCIVMGDIDNFKELNDEYGHEFGDEVLVVVAKYIKDLLPESYLKARWGGEEFLIAANDTTQTVYEKTEQLRVAISKHSFAHNVKITITFGIADYSQKSELNAAINTADRRLYSGKKATKNCTVCR